MKITQVSLRLTSYGIKVHFSRTSRDNKRGKSEIYTDPSWDLRMRLVQVLARYGGFMAMPSGWIWVRSKFDCSHRVESEAR